MRRILCEKCLRGHLPAGTRKACGASLHGPAQHQRLVLGTALNPTKEQRTVYLNGEPKPLPMGMLNCDSCDDEIRPESVCAGWSVWRADRPPVGAWEEDYLVPLTVNEYENWKRVTARIGDAQKAK